MKSTAINTGASMPASITTFQDGDVFRESAIDLMIADIADALGYLQNIADDAALLAGANTWTGLQTFTKSPICAAFTETVTFAGFGLFSSGSTLSMASGSAAQVGGGASFTLQSGASVSLAADMTMTGKLTKSGAAARIVSSTRQAHITEANFTAGADYDHVRMTITSGTSRLLTLKVAALQPVQGERIEVRRDGGGAGVLVVVNEGIAGTIVDFSDDGAASFVFDGDQWRLHGHHNGNPGAEA